jgi:hypothetical protein
MNLIGVDPLCFRLRWTVGGGDGSEDRLIKWRAAIPSVRLTAYSSEMVMD